MIQGSPEWFAARLGRVTASRVADIMARTKSGPAASRKNYMMQLLCERLTQSAEDGFTNAAMQRGTELEPVARSWYEVETGNLVEETGLVQHPDIDMFAASPDGLVGDDGLIEIKCPNTATHITTLESGKVDSKYQWQMLCQMDCTGRDWCDFVSYDDRLPEELQGIVLRFERDDKRVQEMRAEVQAFLSELDQLETKMRERMKEKQQ